MRWALRGLVLLAMAAVGAADCAYTYGIDDNNQIIEYNPELGIAPRLVLNTGLVGFQACNSFAFDKDREQLFWIYSPQRDRIYWWDTQATSINFITTLPTPSDLYAGANPANAAFYNNAFWFIKGNQLIKADIAYIANNPSLISLVTSWTLTISFTFGDIAIDDRSGVLYGSSTDGEFFTLNTALDSLGAAGSTVTVTVLRNNGASLPFQLAFNGDYTALYGAVFNTGQWYTIDPNDGVATPISGYEYPASGARDLGGSACIAANPGAYDDPHLVGGNGALFDFDGQLNAAYTLFSAPQFQVNMRIAGDGPKPHFMTEVGLLFRDESFLFTVVTMNENFREVLEAKLERAGGRLVRFQHWEVVLELCPGQRVTITQKHTTEGEPELWHADGRPFYYLDVKVSVPRCHGAYGGVLGQTYQCKYVRDGEPFAWSAEREEAFRLPQDKLFGTSGAFAADAGCFGSGGEGVTGRTTKKARSGRTKRRAHPRSRS